jgi:NDP-sugar pyrophosphorylase family protein
MSGFGERFRRVGYKVPKPLIEIDGKPIIAHVIDMFPGEQDFTFICNQEHLDNPDYKMEEQLLQYCPTGKIVGILPHKLGPVHAVQQVADSIDLEEPVIVNYCDFTCYWDWNHFKSFVEEIQCQGAIPAYKGFHPHTLGSTNYAYMKESAGWVQDIQEKQPYTENRMEEFASSGTYYFASGKVMLNAMEQTVKQDLNVGGEYYVSLVYKPMLAKNMTIAVYPLQHFMQWGTPADVAEYQGWSSTFRNLLGISQQPLQPKGAVVIPLAGLGQRFKNEGYTQTKPLIPVSGKPMVIQATNDLPKSEKYVFVLRSDMDGYLDVSNEIQNTYHNSEIKFVPSVTEGQACTAKIGIENLSIEPITFGACDNGAIYDTERLNQLFENKNVDIVVWGVRGHANAVRKPEMFGWIDADQDGKINGISVKKPLAEPSKDPIVLGTFSFKSVDIFNKVIDRLKQRDGRVNGEFYLDSCINDAIELGLNCYLFEVENFISWGTPNDLKTFEYWQSCFHKWSSHPYSLEKDNRINTSDVDSLAKKFQKSIPNLPNCL